MALPNYFSQEISTFHARKAPETATLVGYGAVIESLQLKIPMPVQLSIISKKHKKYEVTAWKVFTPRYQPGETLYDHLVFALKYEGVNLLVFKKLFENLTTSEVESMVQYEPQGKYSRKIWFLYEWLFETKLSIPDLLTGNYVSILDSGIQYEIEKGEKLKRYRIINNLPGTPDFCPLVRKTVKLEKYITSELWAQNDYYLKGLHKDILLRTSAFLMLQDSKASFNIEGESPPGKRTARWAKAIGQAGSFELSKNELLRLQQIVIENDRFIKMGFRKEGGFVGVHDRNTGEPIPDHISARWDDVERLVDGLLSTYKLIMNTEYDSVISAAVIAFGFVFIHPFEDGNGRIHRFIIHHILARKKFTQQGIIFPVSASMLYHIDDYRKILESYSQPLLDFIDWDVTSKHNVTVLNETIDFYRYFDATKQVEFLYDCVNDTIQNIIPNEISYLIKYDDLKQYLDNKYEMPDTTVALLVKFLEQNGGKLSKRAREKEFSQLSDDEVSEIEDQYHNIFIK